MSTFRKSLSIPSSYSTLSKNPRSNNAITEVFSGKFTFSPNKTFDAKKEFTNLPQEHRERAEFSHEQKVSKELKETVESIAYIADHMKAEMTYKKVIKIFYV